MGRGLRRRLPLFAALAALALFAAAVVTGCGGDSDSGGNGGGSSDQIKIGAVHPLTGDLALDGNQSSNGAKLAAEEINEAGGIESLDGAQLEVLASDSKGAPETGRTEAQRLVDAGAVALVGAYQSAVSQNIMTVASRSGVPFVMDITAADEVLEQNAGGFGFRVQPQASKIGSQAATYLTEIAAESGTELKTVAYMHDNSEFGTSIADAFEEQAKSEGLEVVLRIPYDPLNATDFTTEISRVKASGADVLAVTGYVPDGELIANNVAAVKPGVKLVYGVAQAAFELPEFYENVGAAKSEGVMAATIRPDQNKEEYRALAERYEERYGEPMRLSAAYAYQAVQVVAAALEEAGSTDRSELRDAIAQVRLDDTVLAFPIEFGSDGENVDATPIIVQHQDGKLVQVAPESVAEAKPEVGRR